MEASQKPRILKPPPRNRRDLQHWMNGLLNEFNHSTYLETDPIHFPHSHSKPADRELISLIAALFSFGNIRSIKSSLTEILKPLGRSPHERLLELEDIDIKRIWAHAYYRFYAPSDIQHLFKRLRDLAAQHSSIENFFRGERRNQTIDPLEGLTQLREWFLKGSKITPGLRFMFADPHASPSKRWHMWLRWLVRKDEIDFGLWTSVKTSQLTLPLDTHVFDMVQHLGLTQAKTPSRRVALEVTDRFREWDPQDPVKYDFALCRLGVLGFKKTILAS